MSRGVRRRNRRDLVRALTTLEQDYLTIQQALAALVLQLGGVVVLRNETTRNLEFEVVINVDREPVSGDTRVWTTLDGKPYRLGSPAGQPAGAHAHSLPPRGGGSP